MIPHKSFPSFVKISAMVAIDVREHVSTTSFKTKSAHCTCIYMYHHVHENVKQAPNE